MTSNLDHTMMALADPTRRAILVRLSHGEARVTDIAEPFAISLNAVSKHILILERAGLVRRRRQGREHFLSGSATPLAEAAHWIEKYRESLESSFQRLDELLTELKTDENKRERNQR